MRKKVWIGIWILAWAALGAGAILLLNKLTFQRLDAPLYLLGLLLIGPLLFWIYRSGQLQQKRLDLLYDHALQARLFIKSPAALWRQYLPFIALLACCCVALARPQGPMVLGSATSNGVDILIGIDVSDSMKATDESYPNRMGAAANVIRQLLPFFEGDRVGLFVFSGEAFSLAPFTYDHGTLNTFLDEINTNLLPSETTDLEEAFKHALTRFGLNPEKQKKAAVAAAPQEKTGQLLMLFSDGENQLGDYNDEVALLAKNKVPVFTVGLGTTAGARIPVNTMMGRSYKMWRGQPAVTKLNPKLLTRIAKQTSGTYLPLKSINQLPTALTRAKGSLQINSNDRKIQQFEERYAYWILLGFLLFFTLPLLWAFNFQAVPAYRFRFKKKGVKMSAAKGIPVGLVVVLLSPLLQSAWSPGSDWNSLWNYFYSSQGKKAYEAQDFKEAEKSFEQGLDADPENAILRNNQAHAQYKGKNYDKATENFKENLQQDQLSAQQKANTHYNLGNSYFRQGEKSWQDAVKSYQEALKINPKDKQALENLNFVQEKIAQQKKQQKQGNNSKNQQQQQQKKGDSPDKKQSKDNNDGNKKPQQTPQSVPTPEPSPQYYDKKELEQALKQREEDERRNKNNFHRFRKKQKQAAKDKAGEPWEQDVKNW